tara:strand:+ start:6344 stop:7084 length:741 start_codon:yes stop_codon:yes gene_type:complete
MELYDAVCESMKMYHVDAKTRLGNEDDGGYVIMELDGYDHLISGGVGGDIGFEKAFTAKYGVECTVYDGTDDLAEDLCRDEPNITFVKKNIGVYETSSTTNLKTLIAQHNEVFLKMDIEGGEFPFLMGLTLEELKKVKQITMEFHFPSQPWQWSTLLKLCETHYMIHYHANNNNCVIYPTSEIAPHREPHLSIPAVFECTYVRKDCFSEPPRRNTLPLPTELDRRNRTTKLDFLIDCEPWVHREMD